MKSLPQDIILLQKQEKLAKDLLALEEADKNEAQSLTKKDDDLTQNLSNTTNNTVKIT